jgi:Uri superfamily endonuclease
VDQISTGSYVLLLHLAENQIITVGRLGTFDFPAGWYTYIGSALARAACWAGSSHHLRPPKSPHWHIDYFTPACRNSRDLASAGYGATRGGVVDTMILIPGAVALIEGFGASDTTKETHLFYFDVRPLLEDFAVGVHKQFPGTQVIRAYAAQAD